jgi:hypothetical protein
VQKINARNGMYTGGLEKVSAWTTRRRSQEAAVGEESLEAQSPGSESGPLSAGAKLAASYGSPRAHKKYRKIAHGCRQRPCSSAANATATKCYNEFSGRPLGTGLAFHATGELSVMNGRESYHAFNAGIIRRSSPFLRATSSWSPQLSRTP